MSGEEVKSGENKSNQDILIKSLNSAFYPKTDDIKRMLGIPEFPGIRVMQPYPKGMAFYLPPQEEDQKEDEDVNAICSAITKHCISETSSSSGYSSPLELQDNEQKSPMNTKSHCTVNELIITNSSGDSSSLGLSEEEKSPERPTTSAAAGDLISDIDRDVSVAVDNGKGDHSQFEKKTMESRAVQTEDLDPIKTMLERIPDAIRRFPPPRFSPFVPPQSENVSGRLHVTPQATLMLIFDCGLKVNITTDFAIRLMNPLCESTIAVSSDQHHVAMSHPMGRVLQRGTSLMHVSMPDLSQPRHRKHATLSPHSIDFTADSLGLVWVLDDAGVRSTVHQRFYTLPEGVDLTTDVLYGTAQLGFRFKTQAEELASNSICTLWDNGVTQWCIGPFQIFYKDEDVWVYRCPDGVTLRCSARTGQASIKTNLLYCTASQAATPHLFLRCGGHCKLHYNGREMCVRVASQPAALNQHNVLDLNPRKDLEHRA